MLAFGAAAHGSTLAKSRFSSGTEHWKAVAGVGGDQEDPDFNATGGNPGGYVSATDAADGAMYWRAPTKFRGNKADAYGGTLRFDLAQSSGASQFDDDDVILEGGGRTLIFYAASNPSVYPLWTTRYAVPLTKTVWTDATGTPEPATRRDIKRALGSIDDLLIRAEYSTGPDTDALGNVLLKTP
jgi:hypothetical protein